MTTKPRPAFRLAVAERPIRSKLRLGPEPFEVIAAAKDDLKRHYGEAFVVTRIWESKRKRGVWFLYGKLEVPRV